MLLLNTMNYQDKKKTEIKINKYQLKTCTTNIILPVTLEIVNIYLKLKLN